MASIIPAVFVSRNTGLCDRPLFNGRGEDDDSPKDNSKVRSYAPVSFEMRMMSPMILHALLLFIVTVLTGCGGGPPNWRQFHGDLSNGGLHLKNSPAAAAPVWSTEPYNIGTSSPVVGKDFAGREVIYVGSGDGRLIAINSDDGSEKWHISFGGSFGVIVAAPAVSENNYVYIVTTKGPDDEAPRSVLRKVDPSGFVRWSFEIPGKGMIWGSPKIVETEGSTFIFVYVREFNGELFVLRDDENRAELLDRKALGKCSGIVTGSSAVFDFLRDLWRLYTTIPFAFDPSGSTAAGIIEPTPAIRTEGRRSVITIADNVCNVGAYEWTGTTLNVLWRQVHDGKKHTSPVILGNSVAAVGRDDGRLIAYDLETGAIVWEYDAGEKIVATPAAFLTVLFVVSSTHIHVINAAAHGTLIQDGATPRKQPFDVGTASSPALTANHLYVASPDQMLTVSYDLLISTQNRSFLGNGASSVAIGNDGSVFPADTDGRLVKFPGTE